MTNLTVLKKEELYELLAKHTAEYTRLFAHNGDPVEMERLQGIMLAIQDELANRKVEENQE